MRKLSSTSLVLAAALVVPVLSIFLCASASAQAPDPFAALEGRWIWIGSKDNPGLEKACAEKWTELKFSGGRKVLTYRYAKEGGTAEGSYNVLYQEGNSIAMYMNGETRKLSGSNDRFIWIAVIENKDRFLWRIHSQQTSAEELAKYARIRCPGR